MAGMWSVLNLHGNFWRIRQAQEKSLIMLCCSTQCFISCDVTHISASWVFIFHTSMLSCKQPESMNSHTTEGGETLGQRACPPINPCNEIGQYNGASAHPSLIGQLPILISPEPGILCPWRLDPLLNPIKYIGVPQALQPGGELATCSQSSLKPGEKTLFVLVLVRGGVGAPLRQGYGGKHQQEYYHTDFPRL